MKPVLDIVQGHTLHYPDSLFRAFPLNKMENGILPGWIPWMHTDQKAPRLLPCPGAERLKILSLPLFPERRSVGCCSPLPATYKTPSLAATHKAWNPPPRATFDGDSCRPFPWQKLRAGGASVARVMAVSKTSELKFKQFYFYGYVGSIRIQNGPFLAAAASSAGSAP